MIALTKIPEEYEVVRYFCDATGSQDPDTCKLFCAQNSNKQQCAYDVPSGFPNTINGIKIACGGKVTYGWEVQLKTGDIPTEPIPTGAIGTPMPTRRASPTPSRQPTPSPTLTPTPTGQVTKVPTAIPDEDSPNEPTATRSPTSTPTPTLNYRLPTGVAGCNQQCGFVPSIDGEVECKSGLICMPNQIGRGSRCVNPACPQSGTCVCPTRVVPTRTPTPTATLTPAATITPIPTITPIATPQPCSFTSEAALRIKTASGTKEFDMIKRRNTMWYTTNDVSTVPLYFNNGKITYHNPNFRLEERPATEDPTTRNRTRYYAGDTACIKIHYDTEMYEIASTEVGPGKLKAPDEICGLPLVCGVHKYSWTFQRKNTSTTPNLKVAFIGDQGLVGQAEAQPDKVLELIKREGAEAVLILGDLDYSYKPDLWDQMMRRHLPQGFPVFIVGGNHDLEDDPNTWLGYKEKIAKFLQEVPDAYCTDESTPGTNLTCTYKGMTFSTIYAKGDPQRNRSVRDISAEQHANTSYLQSSLAASDSLWKVCGWHRNMTEMQLGTKIEEFIGWGPYQACAGEGAIIATAHEHSYHRSKTLVFGPPRMYAPDSSCADGGNMCLGPGRSFVVVTGLGGAGDRRWQVRCGENMSIGDRNCNDRRGNDIWAKMYASTSRNFRSLDRRSQSGALFITFNVENNPNRAIGYFKTVDNVEHDRFYIHRTATGGAPAQSSFEKTEDDPSLSAESDGQYHELNVHALVTNLTPHDVKQLTFRICEKDDVSRCETVSKPLNVSADKPSNVSVTVPKVAGSSIMSNKKYAVKCSLQWAAGGVRGCGERDVYADDAARFEIELEDEESIVNVTSYTEHETVDLNRDGGRTILDCVEVFTNFHTPAADVNHDNITNSLDVSICYKWLGK